MASSSARNAFWGANGVLFDFDGVLVNSNPIKYKCFFELLADADYVSADSLTSFIATRPHASRFEVVDFLTKEGRGPRIELREHLLAKYSECTKSRVSSLRVSPALSALREQDERKWGLISATEERDMREIALSLGISTFFELGVFGSPASKESNIGHAVSSSVLRPDDLVMLGDRRSDMVAARNAGVNFIFVSGWSDESEQVLRELRGPESVDSLADLLPPELTGQQ